MKKFIIIIAVVILLVIAALAGVTTAYTKTSDYSSDKFPANTNINGVDCSELTFEQAEKELTKKWNNRHITVSGSMGEQLASYTDFGYEYNLKKQLKNAKKNHIVAAAVNHYVEAPLNMTVPMKVSECSEEFKASVTDDPYLNSEGSYPCQNAYVDLTDPEFNIIHEAYGTEVDKDKFFEDLTQNIQAGKMQLVFEENNYYTVPEITAEDPSLIKYQKYCREHLTQKITYELGDSTFTIPAEDLANMLADDMSGNVDPKGVKAYVAKLAGEYDNVGTKRSFKSFDGSTITVSGGIYGWIIDQKAETKKLISDLESGKDVSRSPIFSQKGYGTYAKVMGDTYIDVNISKQYIKYYKKGELVFESICVTGSRLTGTLTDIGTMRILNKIMNVTLKGDNGDGTEYEAPVTYWLGINWTGEGFHDATWRGDWSGNAWTYDGSHGCINMPYDKMSKLYNLAVVGTPVIVHY